MWGVKGGKYETWRGVSRIPVVTKLFILSGKSRNGESRLDEESWGLDGVRGVECWESPVRAGGDSPFGAFGAKGDFAGFIKKKCTWPGGGLAKQWKSDQTCRLVPL